MVDDDSFNLVVEKETDDASVVRPVRAFIVEALPVGPVRDPVLDLAILNVCNSHLVCLAPTQVKLPIRGHGNCNNHLSVLSSTRHPTSQGVGPTIRYMRARNVCSKICGSCGLPGPAHASPEGVRTLLGTKSYVS